MAYFTLVSFDRADPENGWAVEFGDYDKETVEYERDDMRGNEPAMRFKIIRTKTARQSEINAALAALNATKGA